MSEIPEVKSLRWLANMFPLVENPEDEADKMSSCIHLYCTAAADKMEKMAEELIDKKETLSSKKEFRNELVSRLNNISRYHGGVCNGREFPEVETFDVDEVYEIIDRVFDSVPEDTNEPRFITVQDCENLKLKFDKYCETAEQHEFVKLAMINTKFDDTLRKIRTAGKVEDQKDIKAMFRVILKAIGEEVPDYFMEDK